MYSTVKERTNESEVNKMTTTNQVRTIEEYIAMGFTAEEAPLVRKHDCMFDNWEHLTEREKERYFIIQAWLGL
jgi:hypothetical protein